MLPAACEPLKSQGQTRVTFYYQGGFSIYHTISIQLKRKYMDLVQVHMGSLQGKGKWTREMEKTNIGQ